MEEDGTTAQLTGTASYFLNETTSRSDLIEDFDPATPGISDQGFRVVFTDWRRLTSEKIRENGFQCLIARDILDDKLAALRKYVLGEWESAD
ncbi:hypothetical protein NW766_000804 [Fusarium irregulare]|uniref:Uncharacterized protein n=1 Tax=Fusarium irregulare TaxID=2494466 RepID=A0A9W8Q2L9_9HYPO|nr:hypothetical protein NW766_000804 [Fusarium irregulare]